MLLDTGSAGQPYLYGVNCRCRNGQWCEGGSGNGAGWSSPDEEGALGTWSLWDDAPTDADMVRVEFAGAVSEHPIRDGAYLVVWFRQPVALEPRVTAVRINGDWIQQPA